MMVMFHKGVELYCNRGRVGVLVSPGFGAGWSTWECEQLAYDKRVVEFWKKHKDDRRFMDTVDDTAFGTHPESAAHREAMEFFGSIGYGSPYMGGFSAVELKYVKPGVPFRIEEYDGWETLKELDMSDYTVFGYEQKD